MTCNSRTGFTQGPVPIGTRGSVHAHIKTIRTCDKMTHSSPVISAYYVLSSLCISHTPPIPGKPSAKRKTNHQMCYFQIIFEYQMLRTYICRGVFPNSFCSLQPTDNAFQTEQLKKNFRCSSSLDFPFSLKCLCIPTAALFEQHFKGNW